MKLSPSLLAGAAFALAGGVSVVAAQTVARVLEERSVEAVADRLERDGFAWATVLGDGLQVVLEGEAPTETARFEAISSAATVVDGARVIDNMRVADSEAIAPPAFAVEILRNDSGVSLIGLVPAATDREDMASEIAEAAGGQDVTDLLQTADYPVPEGWDPALAFALDALELLPRSKISVAAGRVSVEAISDSPEERRRLESGLARLVPDGVRLALAVSSPRPVIAPFTVRAKLESGRLSFDACSADTEEARNAILSAAAAAGAEGPIDCRLGLGAPSTEWGAAVAQGIAALHGMGGGTLTFSDADVALVAAPGTDRALFDRIAGELDGALPDLFALEAERPLPATAEEPDQGPPEFTASLDEEGAVRLRGRIEDARMAGLARAFAQARFGAQDVALATRPGGEDLPDGWSMRVLTGIEALSRLAEGTVTVTPDIISVQGRTGSEAARDEIAARAIETLGPGAALTIEVAYDEALDPLAALPSPEECLAKITSVTDAAEITFDPGSATISAEGEPVIEAIAEILRSCPDLRLRIAGYTDAQGREETNLRLSQDRADSVLAALRAERVPVAGFEAQGYGEAEPIASNETEAGREANRRIELSLLGAQTPAVAGAAPAADEDQDGSVPTEASEAGDLPVVRLRASEPTMEKPDAPPLRPRALEVEATAFLAVRQGEADGDAGSEGREAGPLSPEAAIAEIPETGTGEETEAEAPPAEAPRAGPGGARPARASEPVQEGQDEATAPPADAALSGSGGNSGPEGLASAAATSEEEQAGGEAAEPTEAGSDQEATAD